MTFNAASYVERLVSPSMLLRCVIHSPGQVLISLQLTHQSEYQLHAATCANYQQHSSKEFWKEGKM